MGAVSRVPVELTFIQLSSGHFHSCGITLDEKLVCWGGPNPKRFEPPGLYQQVSCGAVHTCGLRKDGQVKCWFVVRRPFFFVGRHASRAFESSSVARSTLSPRLLDGVRTGRVVRHRRESDSERRAGARTTTRAARSRPLESSCRSRRATRFLVVCGPLGWWNAGGMIGKASRRRPTASSFCRSRRRTSSTTRAG